MKRSDFIKTLGALPLGMFAGNELIKNIGKLSDNDELSNNSSIDLNGMSESTNQTLDNKTVNRPDLIDVIIKRTRGKIGNTHIYRHEGTPSMMLEYQGRKLLKINDRVVNRPSMIGSIKQNPLVMKTQKCRGMVPGYKWTDKEVVKSIYDQLVENINGRTSRGGEPDVVILYDIIITPRIYNPQTMEPYRGVMSRSGYIKF